MSTSTKEINDDGNNKIDRLFMDEQIKSGAMFAYIKTILHELGIDEFEITETKSESGNEVRLINVEMAAKIIVDYSVGALRYVHGKNNEPDTLDDVSKDTSLMLFFILESILYAQAKNQETNQEASKINLDCLGAIDANYLLMENFMSGTLAPKVGGSFDPESLKEPNKNFQEISSIQAAKALRLTGLSLISGLNLQDMGAKQRTLFIGGRTIDEITGIVANDIQRLTNETIKAWSINRIDESLLRQQIEQAITKIYESQLNSEFAALQKELTALDDKGKRDYLDMIKSKPDGNLTERTRMAIKKLMDRADEEAQQVQANIANEDSPS